MKHFGPPLTTEPSEGFFIYRSGQGHPAQPISIAHSGGLWHVLIRGQPAPGSPARDWLDIPILKFHWPLHAIPVGQYESLRRAYETALPGSPLLTPDRPVNLRAAAPVGRV